MLNAFTPFLIFSQSSQTVPYEKFEDRYLLPIATSGMILLNSVTECYWVGVPERGLTGSQMTATCANRSERGFPA